LEGNGSIGLGYLRLQSSGRPLLLGGACLLL
jgi:hypothetical protein